MQLYTFPTIAHIDDVLPHIEGCDEFRVVDKGDYTVINYVVASNQTFPPIKSLSDQIKRECRGIVFDKTDMVINRRFHKFFNLGEREETLPENVDFSYPHEILEKLDGSMVSPCLLNGKIRWMTKMGITDVSMQAEEYIKNHMGYNALFEKLHDMFHVPIFEWCSNKNRIVLSYEEDRLVLTAIRNMRTGNYWPLDFIKREADLFNIPCVKSFPYDAKNILDIVKQQEDVEGVVIRFNGGHMIKVKADWYVRIHKVKALFERERDVVAAILNNEVDDIAPILPPNDLANVQRFQEQFLVEISRVAELDAVVVSYINSKYETKKDFALSKDFEDFKNVDPFLNNIIFKNWKTEFNMFDVIIELIKDRCNSASRYEEVKKAYFPEVNLHGNKSTED